ncbi:MAG: hypothetical protein N3A01_01155 [Bacteroidales bacterium]|nr:hypothetical protein [Bacteroidales bacterium]
MLILLFFSINIKAQSLLKVFLSLECPEKWWVITHIFKAKKIYKLSQIALKETELLRADTTLDGDICGGQLDAFRHAYWMALVTKYYGPKRALSLGKAHERSNYKMFLKGKLEEHSYPDYESTQMDYLNNDVGIYIGKEYKFLSDEELKKTIVDYIKAGKLYVLKKDNEGNYLDCDGNKIILKEKKWITNKCIVASDYKTKK